MDYFLLTVLGLTGFLLMGIVLLQRGRGGGLAGAFGGLGGQSAFGTKAGDVFTKITIGITVFWVFLAGGSGFALRYYEENGSYEDGKNSVPDTPAASSTDKDGDSKKKKDDGFEFKVPVKKSTKTDKTKDKTDKAEIDDTKKSDEKSDDKTKTDKPDTDKAKTDKAKTDKADGKTDGDPKSKAETDKTKKSPTDDSAKDDAKSKKPAKTNDDEKNPADKTKKEAVKPTKTDDND
jgi:preprotein translocase subunit SecG